MDKAARFKERLAKRKEQLQELEAPKEELTLEQMEVEADEFDDFDELFTEDEESAQISPDLVETVFGEGYEACLQNNEQNPFLLIEGELEESDQFFAEIWEEGWATAKYDKTIANVILLTKVLVEGDDDEQLEELHDALVENLTELENLIDFNEYAEYWWGSR